MPSPTRISHYGDLTLDQARLMRMEQAKYRQSARNRRLLGERIRGERSQSPALAKTNGPNVVRLNPRAPAALPQTGRVA